MGGSHFSFGGVMPRLAKKNPTSRLNLEMGQATRDRLEALRDLTHADSLAEVIRHALAAYDFLVSEKRKDGQLVIRYGDGKEKEVELL